MALTEAAIAIDADTPHTAPPTPNTAASRLSIPKTRVPTKYITRQVMSEITVAWTMATGPALSTSAIGNVAPSRTMPILMKYSTRNALSIHRGNRATLAITSPRMSATSGASRLNCAAFTQPEIENMTSDNT